MDRRLAVSALLGAGVLWASLGHAATATTASGPADLIGRLHPVLVHFPVALILTAFVAEMVFVARRDERLSTAARVMIHVGAWVGAAAALAGFVRADAIVIAPDVQHAFAVHRIAGIAVPVLAFLAAAFADGVRRSGQIWELFVYRIVLALAAAAVVIAGYHGGELVYGAGFFSLW